MFNILLLTKNNELFSFPSLIFMFWIDSDFQISSQIQAELRTTIVMLSFEIIIAELANPVISAIRDNKGGL